MTDSVNTKSVEQMLMPLYPLRIKQYDCMEIFKNISSEMIIAISGALTLMAGWVGNIVFFKNRVKRDSNSILREEVKLNDDLIISLDKLQKHVSVLLDKISERDKIIRNLSIENAKLKKVIVDLNDIINDLKDRLEP